MIRELRSLGYRVGPVGTSPGRPKTFDPMRLFYPLRLVPSLSKPSQAMPPEIAADAIAGRAQDTSASKSAQGLFFIFFPPFWRDLCFESNSIMVYLEGPHRIWRVFR